MTTIISNIKHHFICLNIVERLLAFFPLFAVMGSLSINIFYFIIIILFFINIKDVKFNLNFKNKIINYIIFSYFVIFISYVFSDYKNTSSLIRTISVIKFCFIPIIFYTFVNSKSFFKILGIVSGFVTIFLCLDIIFQFIFGYDFFGYKPILDNRYSGFLDEELVAGSFISFFSIYFIISTKLILDHKTDLIILLVLCLFYLSTVIITGERLALIRILFIFFCLLIFLKIKFWKKCLAGTIIFLSIITFFNLNNSFKNRIYETLFMSGINTNYEFNASIQKLYGENRLFNSPWISHWKVANKIYQDNKLTGVGLKNFRVLSCNYEKYKTRNLLYDSSCTTHPHNIYMEILSELGIFGMVTFIFLILIFIRKYHEIIKKTQETDVLVLSSLILFLLIPILPSGSLFSSYNGGIIFYFVSSYIALLKLNEFIK